MSDYIYQDMSHAQRVATLKKLCKAKETITYTKSLSDVELAAEEKTFAQDNMRITQLEDELKTVSVKYKAEIASLKKLGIERLEVIANQKRQVYGQVFGLPDQVKNKMLFYDEAGELVSSRDLFESEKQGTLFVGDQAQTPAVEMQTSGNVLDAFKDAPQADVVKESPDGEDYEPSVQEEAPDESDLDNAEMEEAGQEEAPDDGGVLGTEEETTGDPETDPPGEAISGEEPEEDWRAKDLKEETAKAEKAAGKEKKPRAPRKKKDAE